MQTSGKVVGWARLPSRVVSLQVPLRPPSLSCPYLPYHTTTAAPVALARTAIQPWPSPVTELPPAISPCATAQPPQGRSHEQSVNKSHCFSMHKPAISSTRLPTP